jgi:hypothetical protein
LSAHRRRKAHDKLAQLLSKTEILAEIARGPVTCRATGEIDQFDFKPLQRVLDRRLPAANNLDMGLKVYATVRQIRTWELGTAHRVKQTHAANANSIR